MYTRKQEFVPGAFLRPCDLCGIRFRAHELTRGEDGFWRCNRWCVEVPAITRDKISAASQKRQEAPPPPYGLAYGQKDTYGAEEAIFDFICNRPSVDANWTGGYRLGVAPSETLNVASGAGAVSPSPTSLTGSINAAGETLRYLYGIVNENKRPTRWIARATAKMIEIADWLIAHQRGFGVASTDTKSTEIQYGAFVLGETLIGGDPSIIVDDVAMCGLGLLYTYRVTGTAKYLTSAKATASFLRNMQSIGAYLTNQFTSSDAAGLVRLYTGSLIHAFDTSTETPADNKFYPSSLIALEFWRELLSTDGDGNYGADTTIGGVFIAAPQQLLSRCIADIRAFWTVGAYDNVTGTTFTGLSSTSPREMFNAYPTGTGSWEFANGNASVGNTITSASFAMALRSLFQYEGYSSQVSSIWTWLMSFGPNPAYIRPAGTLASDFACAATIFAANPPAPPTGSGNVVAPFYDPTLALTTTLVVRQFTPGPTAAKLNATALYDWSTAGMLAAIQTAQNQGAFKLAKDKLIESRFRMPIQFSDPTTGPQRDFIMLRGQSGLAFQLNDNVPMTWSTLAAARIGNVFRYQPQSWTGVNPPSQQPGVKAA